MASTTAKTKTDVDQLSAKDRLWDSLGYTYGKQVEASDKSYNQAISQQDRALLSRGMQRSSYGMQTLANLQNQKVNAQNDIGYAKIADYENRLDALEQQERQNEQWEREFGLQKEQFDYSKQSADQQIAAGYVSTIIAQGGDPSDELLARAGLTRADANSMKAQTKSSGGRGGTRSTSGNIGDNSITSTLANSGLTDSGFINDLWETNRQLLHEQGILNEELRTGQTARDNTYNIRTRLTRQAQ